jgi:hypothetical protein
VRAAAATAAVASCAHVLQIRLSLRALGGCTRVVCRMGSCCSVVAVHMLQVERLSCNRRGQLQARPAAAAALTAAVAAQHLQQEQGQQQL